MIHKTINKKDLEVINIGDMKAMWDCGFNDNRIVICKNVILMFFRIVI